MINRAIVDAWDQAPGWRIHPTREHESEDAYWASGRETATIVSAAFPKAKTVLDFGCGDGRVSLPLADLGYDVIAADSSANHLARLTDPRIRTVHSDGTDLLADLGAHVDAVVCVAVLIHYDYASGRELMAQFSRVLRPGGTLVLDAPAGSDPRDDGGWIGVTTWDEQVRDAHLADHGLTRARSDSRFAVYRRA